MPLVTAPGGKINIVANFGYTGDGNIAIEAVLVLNKSARGNMFTQVKRNYGYALSASARQETLVLTIPNPPTADIVSSDQYFVYVAFKSIDPNGNVINSPTLKEISASDQLITINVNAVTSATITVTV